MYFFPFFVYTIIVYAVIRNIQLGIFKIVLISIFLGAVQWFVVIFCEHRINELLRTFPKPITLMGSFIFLFMPILLAIVIRKYFAYQKKKRAEISNKSDEQTKA